METNAYFFQTKNTNCYLCERCTLLFRSRERERDPRATLNVSKLSVSRQFCPCLFWSETSSCLARRAPSKQAESAELHPPRAQVMMCTPVHVGSVMCRQHTRTHSGSYVRAAFIFGVNKRHGAERGANKEGEGRGASLLSAQRQHSFCHRPPNFSCGISS